MENKTYLFRGQIRKYGERVRIGDGAPLPGKWLYGGVRQGRGDFSIIYGNEDPDDPTFVDKFPVYTETLGQHIGRTDKNGIKVFEGDIVRHYNRQGEPETYDMGVIFWDIDECQFRRTSLGSSRTWVIGKGCDYEVVGNIHDNKIVDGAVVPIK